MNIEKRLEWEPTFDNQIDIEEGLFLISITKKEVGIQCYEAGKAIEYMSISLEKLESLIKEIKES